MEKRMVIEKMEVTVLAAITGMSLTSIPYVNHKSTPVVNIMYMGNERLLVSLVLRTLTA